MAAMRGLIHLIVSDTCEKGTFWCYSGYIFMLWRTLISLQMRNMILIPYIAYILVNYWLILSISAWENITDKERQAYQA